MSDDRDKNPKQNITFPRYVMLGLLSNCQYRIGDELHCVARPPPLSALVSRVATRGLRLRIHIPYANGSEDQFPADCESTLTVRRRTFALPGREVLTLPIRLPERWFPPIARRIRNSKIDLLEHLGT